MEKQFAHKGSNDGLRHLNFNNNSTERKGFEQGGHSPSLQQSLGVERPKKMRLNYDMMSNRI